MLAGLGCGGCRNCLRGRGGSAVLRLLCILRTFQRPSGRGCDWGAPGRAVPVHRCLLPNKVPERQEEEADRDIRG